MNFRMPIRRLCGCGLAAALAANLTLSSASGAPAAGLDDAKMGLAELVRGNFERAVVYNTRAIESGELERESLAIAYYNRASGYQRLDMVDQAKADYLKAYRAWPEHPMTRDKMRDLGLFD